ncbi:MAG TPA: asparagine synthase-related protein [Caldilineaceae bacterium]|nr:asparagine synthase-related protein [Caldilineaceae bacterium]
MEPHILIWLYKQDPTVVYTPSAHAAELPETLSENWSWLVGYLAGVDGGLPAEGTFTPHSAGISLLKSLQATGPAFAGKVHGSCSFIVWRASTRDLLVVSDRGGQYPWYYIASRDRFWVARSPASLAALGVVERRPNPAALVGHMHGVAHPKGDSCYAGIARLGPGEYLWVREGKLEHGCYWRPEPKPLLKPDTLSGYAAAYRSLLTRIIAEYLPAESGITGLTLSGGLDSGSIAAGVSLLGRAHDVQAISYVFQELAEADEEAYLTATAAQTGLHLTKLVADRYWTLSHSAGLETEPADPSVSYYVELWDALFATARQLGIRVLMTGYHGDLLFGDNVFGYPDLLLTGQWRRLLAELQEHRRHSTMSFSRILKLMLLAPILTAYIPLRRWAIREPVPWLRPDLYDVYVELYGRSERSYRLLPGRLHRLLTLRRSMLIVQAEIMSRRAARFGLELRHPLLDHRFTEFALSLPTSATFQAAQRKIVVRAALKDVLPASVVNMRGKIYLGALGHRGLREREQAKVWPLLTNMRSAELGLVDEGRIRQFYADYLAGKHQSTLFWHTLCVEDWLRRYF